MNKKEKGIAVLMALLNLAIAIWYIFQNTENNFIWSLSFFFNSALILLNIRLKVNITLAFALAVYYLYWGIIHWPKEGILNSLGRESELSVSLLAGWAFISMGYIYMINRNRW